MFVIPLYLVAWPILPATFLAAVHIVWKADRGSKQSLYFSRIDWRLGGFAQHCHVF